MKFTIEVEMKDRWVSHFKAMLIRMQHMGGWGSSRVLGFYSDGDGDFRPMFKFKGIENVVPALPVYDDSSSTKDTICDVFYDAG